MARVTRAAFARLWTPTGALVTGPFLAFWRARLVTTAVYLVMLPLIVAAFLSALFLHRRNLGAAGIFFLGVAVASQAVQGAYRIWLVLHLGQWTGFKGEPIRRDVHPTHFWVRTALHAAALVIQGSLAALLVHTSMNIGA